MFKLFKILITINVPISNNCIRIIALKYVNNIKKIVYYSIKTQTT